MGSPIIRTAHPPSYTSILWTKRFDSSFFGRNALKFKRENERRTSLKCVRSSELGAKNSSELNGRNPGSSASVADRLQRLVAEFKSLVEPMDRVKRLLDYAERLQPCDESARSPENRVAGCATQVWVEAEMETETEKEEDEESGRVRMRMRFRADSDSEISKGFCSCLICVLDGADAEEVLGVTTEDFDHVNIGLHGKGHSRVNTWHNVLISMQRRTRDLLEERRRNPPLEGSIDDDEAHVGHHLLSLSASLSLSSGIYLIMLKG